MSDTRRCLSVLAAILCLTQTLALTVAHAEGDHGDPQGEKQATTPLPSGLTAATQAQFGQDGLLHVSTDVPIPVPGVYETRTEVVQGSAGSPGANIPGDLRRGSGPPIKIPLFEITTQFPTGGGNQIVRGGPLSTETGPNGTSITFGGGAIGGFDFVNITPDTTIPAGPTTPWRATTRVVRLDPQALALNVEHDLGFPPIALKVNPDPGLSQLESWFCAQNYGGEVRTRSGTASETHTECRLNAGNLECQPVTNSITVDVRETPTRYAWDFGDNRTAQDGHPASFSTSDGLGRAYTDPYTSSSVQHKYVQSSLKFVDSGGYPIALRITWAAAFRVNGGGWQNLDPVTGMFQSRHQVRESWPVGVNNATTLRMVIP
jgi:hypothetical protein